MQEGLARIFICSFAHFFIFENWAHLFFGTFSCGWLFCEILKLKEEVSLNSFSRIFRSQIWPIFDQPTSYFGFPERINFCTFFKALGVQPQLTFFPSIFPDPQLLIFPVEKKNCPAPNSGKMKN